MLIGILECITGVEDSRDTQKWDSKTRGYICSRLLHQFMFNRQRYRFRAAGHA
jgi:hypothetical protein